MARTIDRTRSSSKPAYTAYTVIERGEGKDNFWNPIGSAWDHEDAKGLTIKLNAFPVNGQIVLREPRDDEDNQRDRSDRRNDNR